MDIKGKKNDIKVVGKGCRKYFELLAVVRGVLSEINGESYMLQEINNSWQISQLGIVHMPALVVNEKIVVQGTMFRRAEVVEALSRGLYA